LLRTSGPIGSNRILFSHGALGVAIGLSLLCAIIGLWPGLVAGLLHAMLYVFVIAPLINALGHWGCARNFENSASNWRLLAWFTGGESLHSNHHAHPRSPKFSVRGSEFDPSWPIIRSLAAAGLLVISWATDRVDARRAQEHTVMPSVLRALTA
jgi:fatty-acid desaturase